MGMIEKAVSGRAGSCKKITRPDSARPAPAFSIVCTIAVMSYVADMSSDVMGYTEPIISCVLSDNTQHKTGN